MSTYLYDYEYAKKLQQEEEDALLAKKLSQTQNQTFCNPQPSFDSNPLQQVLNTVTTMPNNPVALKLADKYGLSINNITWEDCGRWKNSVYGPCISDMTLMVGDSRLPVIRAPNFTDLTWDVPMEKIPLVVGNERSGNVLYTVSLKEYLRDFRNFLHNPQSWKGSNSSLLAERDSHVIMTSQACFLPVSKGTETVFNVSLFNYQSTKENPAVLAIVATSKGTSAQIINSGSGFHGQRLYFNQNGEKCSFVGQRLTDNRIEKGVSTTGPMTQQEKQENMVVIIQVPLKVIKPAFQTLSFGDNMEVCKDELCMPTAAPANFNFQSLSQSEGITRGFKAKSNVEDAIIKLGESEGKFKEMSDVVVERDQNFPVRITLQFYKCTDNGVVDDVIMSQIANQLTESRRKGEFVGSLVVEPNSGRPTEHHQKPTIPIPPWWTNFWLTYKNLFQLTEQDAKNKVFFDGRFSNKTQSESEDQIFAILGHSKPVPTPVWNIL